MLHDDFARRLDEFSLQQDYECGRLQIEVSFLTELTDAATAAYDRYELRMDELKFGIWRYDNCERVAYRVETICMDQDDEA